MPAALGSPNVGSRQLEEHSFITISTLPSSFTGRRIYLLAQWALLALLLRWLASPTVPNHSTMSSGILSRIILLASNKYKPTYQLGFCQLSDWDKGKTYNEHTPIYLHYSMEWKLGINNRHVSKEIEQNLVLTPAAY